jgi:ribosomal protein S18 acetylase RimI-like enzyme
MNSNSKCSVIQGSFPNGLTGNKRSSPRSAQPRSVPTYHDLTLQAHQRSSGLAIQSSGNRNAFVVPPHLATFSRRAGQKLPAAVQQKMESFFGTDFSDVQVHSGPEASSIGALAFTQGSNIYFAPGQYNPNSHFGQALLAHELTHVVQQRSGRVRNPFGSGMAVVQDPILEAEAERMGRQASMHIPLAQPRMGQQQAQQPASKVHFSSPRRVEGGSYKITAEDHGRAVGSVMIHKAAHAVEVTDLGVQGQHRGKGFGQGLISSALRAGLRMGKKRVRLNVGDNGSGRLTKWYRQMGFRQVGRDQQGRPRMEAPISKVLSGVAQGRMRRLLGGQMSDGMAFVPQHNHPLALQPSKRKKSEPEPKKSKKQKSSGEEASAIDIVPLVTWLKAKDPGKQQSNFSVGLTGDGCLIISKVGGITRKSKTISDAIAAYVAEAYPGQQVYLAKKFNNLSPSGNHAEMCVVATANALKKNLTQVTCTHPNCRFCSAMMTFLGIVGNSITKGDPGSQATWCHPTFNAAFGTTFNSNEDTCLEALNTFNAATKTGKQEDYKGEGKLVGGAYYGGKITVKAKKVEKLQ